MRPARFLTGFYYTSVAATFMAWQTFLLLNIQGSFHFLIFIFSLVFIGYNSYFLTSFILSKKKLFNLFLPPFRWRIIGVSVFLPVLLCSVFFVNTDSGILILLVLSFLMYVSIKWINENHLTGILGWLKTIGLSLIWVYVTFGLPISYLHISIDLKIGLLLFQRFCFIMLIALFFDLRDSEKDLAAGKKTIATILSKTALLRMLFIFVSASIVAILLLYKQEFIGGWTSIILAISTISAGGLNLYQEKIKNRLHYLILGDGCMILSTVLLFVERISLLC